MVVDPSQFLVMSRHNPHFVQFSNKKAPKKSGLSSFRRPDKTPHRGSISNFSISSEEPTSH